MLIVTFHNDSSGSEFKNIGNYNVQVMVNNDLIWEGRVEGHKRRLGWRKLIKLLSDKVNEEKQNGLSRTI